MRGKVQLFPGVKMVHSIQTFFAAHLPWGTQLHVELAQHEGVLYQLIMHVENVFHGSMMLAAWFGARWGFGRPPATRRQLPTAALFFLSPTQWLQHPLALLHLPCPPPKRTFNSCASLDHNVGMRVRVCRACRAESQRVAKRTTEWPAQAYTGSPPPLHP